MFVNFAQKRLLLSIILEKNMHNSLLLALHKSQKRNIINLYLLYMSFILSFYSRTESIIDLKALDATLCRDIVHNYSKWQHVE